MATRERLHLKAFYTELAVGVPIVVGGTVANLALSHTFDSTLNWMRGDDQPARSETIDFSWLNHPGDTIIINDTPNLSFVGNTEPSEIVDLIESLDN